MRVDFEHVMLAQAVLEQVNRQPFEDIEWYQNGKPVKVLPKVADDWRFVGMSNSSFVEIAKVEDGVVTTIWEDEQAVDDNG